ncbi:conserved hypothetical protein [Candidatus Desulfarcum epimagneticum]|uniref:Uncharacterized protein n=1 Tax=uncultured Desulfobacteraceae bacterium TaxID=218296 RepID=A0A484HN77_9BACT|nr:conserved hypothetical protein [uncultured Desulfobacteraceae bacterium]
MEKDTDQKMNPGPFVDFGPNRKYSRRLDFEVGYLVKSPCRECGRRAFFPGCLEGCDMIDRVQTRLLESISCTR